MPDAGRGDAGRGDYGDRKAGGSDTMLMIIMEFVILDILTVENKMKRHNFKELLVWQLAMDVVDDIYEMTKKFPREELFGLTTQMRKAAISVPSNIAEGCGRNTNLQLLQFTNIAQGSAFELETQLYIAVRRGYKGIEAANVILEKIKRVQKMIDGFQDRFR